MILSDGTDTREEVRRPGPYCDGLAVVLDYDLSGTGEVFGGDDGGDFAILIGRRVLWVDSQGFKSSSRFASEAEAELALAEVFPYDDETDDNY